MVIDVSGMVTVHALHLRMKCSVIEPGININRSRVLTITSKEKEAIEAKSEVKNVEQIG